MPIPPDDPEECLQQAYRYVRSQKRRFGLTAEEVEDAVGELVCYMACTMLPKVDRRKDLPQQRRWWKRTMQGKFLHWLRDSRNLIRIPGWLWERGGDPPSFAFLDDDRDRVGGAEASNGGEDEALSRIDLERNFAAAKLTRLQRQRVEAAIRGDRKPRRLPSQTWSDRLKKARRKLREAREG